jgi:tetratricopeptide (TPR) repeat protein
MEKISLEGIRVNPDNIKVIKNLAEAYYYQKKYKEAIEYLEKYISKILNENDNFLKEAYLYLGISYLNIESYQKSDIALLTANYYLPNNKDVLLNMAILKEKLKDFEKSKELYNSVLKLEPENAEAKEGLERLNKEN